MEISLRKLRIGELQADFDKKAKKAVQNVALRLLSDAINEVPRPPIHTGNLRASGFVAFENEVLINPRNGQTVESLGLGKYTAQVGFSAPYAARQHERYSGDYKGGSGAKSLETRKRENRGSGSKFLSDKALMFRDRYEKIAAAAMQ